MENMGNLADFLGEFQAPMTRRMSNAVYKVREDWKDIK